MSSTWNFNDLCQLLFDWWHKGQLGLVMWGIVQYQKGHLQVPSSENASLVGVSYATAVCMIVILTSRNADIIIFFLFACEEKGKSSAKAN